MEKLDKYSNDYVVYFHVNPQTDLVFYVGMGNEKRPFNFKKRGIVWNNYVKKYGKPKVVIYKKELSVLEALYLEAHLIKTFGRRRYEKYGVLVNHKLSEIGVSGLRHSEESRNKISEKFKGETGINFGRKATDEAKINMSIAHKGKKWSDAQRVKLEAFWDAKRKHPKKDRTPKRQKKRLLCYHVPFMVVYRFKEHPVKSSRIAFMVHKGNYKATEETKKKISIGNKGKIVNCESRKKMSESHLKKQLFAKKIIDNNTGIVYESMTKAGEAYGVNGKIISQWVTGRVMSRKNQFSYAI